MALLDIYSANPEFSFVLEKNPATQAAANAPFSKSLRKGMVHGWFVQEGQFRLWFQDATNEVSFAWQDTQYEYLDQTRYASPYAPLAMVSELLASALKTPSAKDTPAATKVVAQAMFLPRPGLATLFARHLENNGVRLAAEPLAEKLYRVTIDTERGVRVALSVLAVFCLLEALADRNIYVDTNTAALQKYIRALNTIEAPYFMRYLFIRDAVESPEQFRVLAADLQLPGMVLNYGNTQAHRWAALRNYLAGGDCLVDIGAGEGYYERLAGPRYAAVVAYERDVELRTRTADKLAEKGVTHVQWEAEFTDQPIPEGAHVLLTEVIEHQPMARSEALLAQLAASPAERVLITAPNKAFNAHYGLADDEMRHDDHHFEPDAEGFASLIRTAFEPAGWTLAISGIGDMVDGTPASWLAVASRTTVALPLAA